MNLPLQPYRLSARGGPGLACDEDGLSLGGVELARVAHDETGAVRWEVRSPGDIGHILRVAYGPLTDAKVLQVHRGLCRAAASIGAGDIALAGIEAVMLGLSDLAPESVAKLAEIGGLEKGASTAWETEPRIPPGQPGGGQWTTGGGASSAVAPGASGAPQSARPGRPARTEPASSGATRTDAPTLDTPTPRAAEAVSVPDRTLLIPVSTASAAAAGAPDASGGFAVPEGLARLGRIALLAWVADQLNQLDAASAKAEISRAVARFGLDPSRPADVIAATAYVWAQGNLGFYTEAQFSGPALDAASQAVMRCTLIHPGAMIAILQRSPTQGEQAFNLFIGAANAGLADYAAESRARPAGVAPELQTTSRAARAAIAEQLKSGRMQAHHLVPAYNWGQRVDISALALDAGWKVNDPDNLIALPSDLTAQAEFQARYGEWLPVHQGSHPSYNNETASLILTEEAKFSSNPTPLEARAIMDEVARINRVRLMSGYYGPWVKVGA